MIPIAELHIGQTVRLASGGPKMTVTGFAEQFDRVAASSRRTAVRVVWWSDRVGLCKDQFDAACLVHPMPEAPADGAPRRSHAERIEALERAVFPAPPPAKAGDRP